MGTAILSIGSAGDRDTVSVRVREEERLPRSIAVDASTVHSLANKMDKLLLLIPKDPD